MEVPKTTYTGKIKEIALGYGDKKVLVGGENCYPFYLFEGEMPNKPKIAMDVYDVKPEEWPKAIVELFADVMDDPVAWAKKCVTTFGAEMICLQLVSTDPNGLNRSVDEATEVVKKVADAVEVPLIVWGCGNDEKDAGVLRKVAEECSEKNLILGPVTDKIYKQVGAAAIAYKHTVIASTPIDINLAKQLNILLGDLGVPDDKILVDPTTGGLGYGLEYSYTIMERDRMAALTQEDVKLQLPLICNLAKEVWKTREVNIEDEKFGDLKKRGIMMEAVTAIVLLLAGANILIMRHPEAIKKVLEVIDELSG